MKDINHLQKHDYFGFTCISVQAYTETAITDTQSVVTTTTTVYFNIKLHIHYIKLSYMFI